MSWQLCLIQVTASLSTTADGRTNANEVTDVQVWELDEVANLYILEATPPVLSVGARCMLYGFSFIWIAGECP